MPGLCSWEPFSPAAVSGGYSLSGGGVGRLVVGASLAMKRGFRGAWPSVAAVPRLRSAGSEEELLHSTMGSSWTKIEPTSPAAGSFTTEPLGKPRFFNFCLVCCSSTYSCIPW